MSVMLVTDVFGITPALLKLKDKLGANVIVDPYEGQDMGFKNEADAYSCFVSRIGLDNYVSKLLTALASINGKTTLIGFSMGASAIWLLSLNKDNNQVKQAFCFYGSQIRNATQVDPCFTINLVFPQSESHFDVAELIAKLINKPNVKITQVKYLHGFMNSCSINFNKTGCNEYIALLQSAVS